MGSILPPVFVFTAGRVDRFVAFTVARLVRRWAVLTGKSQVPLAHGVLAAGAAWFVLVQLRTIIAIAHPFVSTMVGVATVAWGAITWQNWRVLQMLEEVRFKEGALEFSPLAVIGIRSGLLARRIWGGMGLFFLFQSVLLGTSISIAPAALGISLSLYVMMCITPGGGKPVWQRGRERLRDAAKRLVPMPAPSPT